MAIKKKGLGRGLGALGLESPKEIFESQSSQKDHGEEAGARLTELSVEQLRPGKYQPRTHMDPESIASLSASIKSQSVHGYSDRLVCNILPLSVLWHFRPSTA